MVTCAECGSEVTRNGDDLWDDGGGMAYPDQGEPYYRDGTTCPSGHEVEDQHVPDLDLPRPNEDLEAWLDA